MAAGLGFKTFTTGEVLTAADVNGYLMQGILVFANAAARTSAITSPQEGQYSFLKDTNALEYYDGAAWVGAPVGDITAVTAGTGISGGGSSGAVTITNDMATTITASGDIVVGTGSGTYDNLPIGSTGQVLTADTTVSPYKVKWAAPSSGAETLLSTTTVSGTSTTISSISQAYRHLRIVFLGVQNNTAHDVFQYKPRNVSNFTGVRIQATSQNSTITSTGLTSSAIVGSAVHNANSALSYGILDIFDYANTTLYKGVQMTEVYISSDPFNITNFYSGGLFATNAIDSFTIAVPSGSLSSGTIKIYGVN